LYSRAFLARYGQRLTRDELRLVQGFRGLPVGTRAQLLNVIATLILGRRLN
jgi:hypothetical protein